MRSNQQQIDNAFQMVKRTNCKRIGVLGFSFKAGTDDLRESPMVELVERLIGKGYQVAVYDKNVSLANLQGANRAYIEQEIPHIASLMCDDIEDVLAVSDVIIIGNGAAEFRQALEQAEPGQVIIDLVRIAEDANETEAQYNGICW
jgi:GDP-mannose 6-dehydrogenase